MNTKELMMRIKESRLGDNNNDKYTTSNFLDLDEVVNKVKLLASENKALPVFESIDFDNPAPNLEVGFNYEKEVLNLNDFGLLNDDEFIRVAYRAILRREADIVGFQHYLDKLSKGEGRGAVLFKLRLSKEGKAVGRKIHGLNREVFIYCCKKVPFVKPVINLVSNIVNLSSLYKGIQESNRSIYDLQTMNVLSQNKINKLAENGVTLNNLFTIESQKFKNEVLNSQTQLDNKIAQHCAASCNLLAAENQKLVREFSDYKSEFEHKITRLQELESNLNLTLTKLEQGSPKLDELEKSCQNLDSFTKEISHTLLNTKDELSKVTSNLKGLSQKENSSAIDTNAIDLDNFYYKFESKFRGTEEDVVNRLGAYDDILNTIASLGFKEPNALDLGCGRGEWLGVLERKGFTAVGVDLNELMINSCLAKGRNAIKQDAIEYLKQQQDSSFSIVSAFHLVEHLPFEDLMIFVQECIRVLKPGGALIFETPNPENLMVSSRLFYMDPTHKNPVVPELLSFIVEYFGCSSVNVLRLNAFEVLGTDVDFGNLHNANMDYSIVARK